MKNIFNKIKKFTRINHKYFFVLFFVLLIFSFFIMHSTMAAKNENASNVKVFGYSISNFFAWIMSYIISVFVSVFGKILVFLITILMKVASYSKIIDMPAIRIAWAVVRDISNMFFVIILLIIAFATILRVENYSVKKNLPKLIIMAVLINFSKTISGIIIDISQVVMLQFISAIGTPATSANIFINIFQVNDYLNLAEKNKGIGTDTSVFFVLMAGLIALLVTIVVVLVLMFTLIMRVAMLWIYVILSPFAYLLAAFPNGKKYSSQWWSEFVQYVVTGPILAFFLWLAIYITQSIYNAEGDNSVVFGKGGLGQDLGGVFETNAFQKYIILIALLYGGLKVTQQVGGAAGAFAGKGMGAINAGKSWTVGMAKKGAKKATVGVAKGSGKLVGRQTLGLVGKGLSKAGKEGGSVNKLGTFMNTWKGDLDRSRVNQKRDKRLATLKKLGMGDDSLGALKDVADSKMGRRTKLVSTGAAAGLATIATGGLAGAVAAGTGLVGMAHLWNKLRKKEKAEETTKNNKSRKDDELNILNDEESAYRSINKISIDMANATLENAKIDAQNMREVEINNAVRDTSLDDDQRHSRIRQANNDYNSAIESAQTAHGADANIRDLNKYKERKDEIAERYKTSKSDEGAMKYHPNQVMMNATKKGSEDKEIAEARIKSLSLDSDLLRDYDKNTFYSGSGFNSRNDKMLSQMANGSEQSVKALDNMVKSLREMEAKGTLNSHEKGLVKSIKMSLAAYEKKGKDLAPLRVLVTQVNKMDHGGNNGRQTVEGSKDSVIIG